jgi:N-acetylglucosaminyl-diphospho-decaprenol L-rhamnosyltransferase
VEAADQICARLMDAVVVVHNSQEDLYALSRCASLGASFSRVLVVDNASTDDSVSVAHAAGFDVLAQNVNYGFAAGANAGIRSTEGDLVTLLNPDIHITDANLVPTLERQFREDAVALVAPALELPDGRIQDSARQVPMPSDLLLRRITHADVGAVRATDPLDVPWVVGAFMMVRRAAFESVGGFDIRYQIYFEDVDLCVRLQAAGWKVRFDPRARAQHHHRAASRKSLAAWSTRQHIRSAGLFYRKYPRFIVRRSIRAVTSPVPPEASVRGANA